MKLTNNDKDYLKSIGFTSSNCVDIEEISTKYKFKYEIQVYTNNRGGETIAFRKLTQAQAIKILGRNNFLSGLAKSAIHGSSARISDKYPWWTVVVYFTKPDLYSRQNRLKQNTKYYFDYVGTVKAMLSTKD